MFRVMPSVAALLLIAVMGLCMQCADVDLEEKASYNYFSELIAVNNADWNVIPLPNNLLNPALQAQIGISIPGVPEAEETPSTISLPTLSQQAADYIGCLGFNSNFGFDDPVADTSLTGDLLAGQNRLSGFIQGFIPKIPVSMPLDMTSIKRYTGAESGPGSAAEANLFFLDVTDCVGDLESCMDISKAVPFPTEDYSGDYMAFNIEGRDKPPYFLTLRNQPPAGVIGGTPQDFEDGHTYLLVLTGYDEKGIKSLPDENAGDVVHSLKPDPYFTLMATDQPFLINTSAEGEEENIAILNNLITDLTDSYVNDDGETVYYVENEDGERCVPTPQKTRMERVIELEGARQIINWGLQVWEGLVGESRNRNEVAIAYHFTIAQNPMVPLLDAVGMLYGNNPMLVSPADYFTKNSSDITKADTATDAVASFTISDDVDLDSINGDTVQLFTLDNGSVKTVAATVGTNVADDGTVTVTVTPTSALSNNTTYWVAANSGIVDEDGFPAVDSVYFGLTRVVNPLVDDNSWLSPYLDSRLDTVLADPSIRPTEDPEGVLNITQDHMDKAGKSLYTILSVAELFRQANQDTIDALLETDFISEREDLVLLWRFTTGQ